MEGLRFLFGVVVSPPWESDEVDLENFYQNSLKPLLSITYRFPDIPLTLFISGPFLSWLEAKHSEFLAALTEMVRRKQVEMLGGGYYGPLLPLLPPSDRIGQIEELTTAVRRLLGRRPRGGWLHKTIWDPSLVLSLTGSGLEYTFLDEEDFLGLGISPNCVGLPRVTENQGRILTCFPVNGVLARRVLEGDLAALDEAIRSRFGDEDSLLAIFLPLSDLQTRPFFNQREGGLESMLEALRSGYPGLVCVHPSGYLKRTNATFERAFFAASDYATLCRRVGITPPPSAERQSWRQFLTDFDESNRLYAKMVHIHLLVSSLRGDKFKKKSALEELWKAQTLMAYIPDGRVSRRCRHRAFQSLISAEVLARDKTSFQSAFTSLDFDLDGIKEFLYQGKTYNLFLDPVGGLGLEWDWLEKPWNWLDADRSEDPIPSKLFLDRFFSDTDREVGSFFKKDFKLVDLNRDQKTLGLSAVENLEGPTGPVPVRLKKSFTFDEQGMTLDIDLELLSGPSWEGWYVQDSYLFCGSGEEASFQVPQHTEQARLLDESREVAFSWEWTPDCSALTEVRYQNSGKFEGDYLAHRFAPRWRIALRVGESWQARVRWTLQ